MPETSAMLETITRLSTFGLLTVFILAGCATTPSDQTLIRESEATVARFVESDPGIQRWVDHAYGYAVFPDIGKGGLGVGGAFGRGIVFEQGRPVGRTTMTQGTVGAQIGAQSYSQMIFFRDQRALQSFQLENFELSAQATAVAATSGAAATTSYERGVAVFIISRGGLMAEATVGGQKFRYSDL
jgi:lipid-binding SYLF domain-containing protein